MEKADPLVLKIRFRMSVSYGYDYRWSWRGYLQGNGKVPEVKEVITSDPALSGEGSYEDRPLPIDPMIPGLRWKIWILSRRWIGCWVTGGI
jgi:hypothetical protein